MCVSSVSRSWGVLCPSPLSIVLCLSVLFATSVLFHSCLSSTLLIARVLLLLSTLFILLALCVSSCLFSFLFLSPLMSFSQLFLGCNRAVGDMATFDDWRAFAEATSQQPTLSRTGTSQSHSSKRSQTQVRSRTCPVSISLRGPCLPHMRPLHSQAGRTIITITVTHDATFTSISILSRTTFKSRLCHAHLSSYNHAGTSVLSMNRISKTQNDPHWKKNPKEKQD